MIFEGRHGDNGSISLIRLLGRIMMLMNQIGPEDLPNHIGISDI